MARIYYVGDWAVLTSSKLAPGFFDRRPFGARPVTYPDRLRLTVEAVRDAARWLMLLGGWYSFAGEMARAAGAGTGDPLLAVRRLGRGRVLAFVSDPAPHWGRAGDQRPSSLRSTMFLKRMRSSSPLWSCRARWPTRPTPRLTWAALFSSRVSS
jgi:hypothetical protein